MYLFTSNASFFVRLRRPILKVVDKLLVMGLLNDTDLDHLLCLINPSVFDPNYAGKRRCDVAK